MNQKNETDEMIVKTINQIVKMEYKTQLKQQLVDAISELSKEDPLLQNVLSAPDLVEFTNRLMAVIPLIIDRERSNQNMIEQFLKTNPHVNRILNIPNDTPELPPIEKSI